MRRSSLPPAVAGDDWNGYGHRSRIPGDQPSKLGEYEIHSHIQIIALRGSNVNFGRARAH